MEYREIISNNRGARQQMITMVLLLLALIIVSQLIVFYMTTDYKSTLIEHDYAVSGYLAENGVDATLIVSAFTAAKNDDKTATGAALLSSAGYRESTQDNLLPSVEKFHQKFTLIVLAILALFALIILTVQYHGFKRRDQKIVVATAQLRHFMDGDTNVRLTDFGEDSLSRLFAAVNAMATSLTAHIEIEKQNREFLKETISDISHQLKTPLAALQMYNEIIANEKTGNAVVESFTEKSHRELERIENLIQSLLKLARLDANAITLEKAAHPLKDFLEHCTASFLTRAEREDKKINLCCSASALLSFDEMWLSEAVGNIIKNALDHTQANDKIDVICEETVVATEIVIRDNGSGIHPEDIHHIFKRFYRSRFSKDKQGVGIGLALAKTIVEKHGGSVTVKSELGKGAEFHLIFPKLTNL